MPTYSTIRKAAAPMTGGIICPLIEDAASMAPAFTPESPVRFMSGIVKMPPETTFDTEDPETTPLSADDTTATFAGPPRARKGGQGAMPRRHEIQGDGHPRAGGEFPVEQEEVRASIGPDDCEHPVESGDIGARRGFEGRIGHKGQEQAEGEVDRPRLRVVQ